MLIELKSWERGGKLSIVIKNANAVVADRNHIPMVMKDAIIYKLY